MVQAGPLKSWIVYGDNSHFPLENIPFGAFKNPRSGKVVCCTRIANTLVDLSVLEHERLLSEGPVMES